MEQPYSEILRYLKLIIKKRYLFVPLSLFIMSIITCYSYFMPKEYEAKSTIFIERNVIHRLVEGIAITPSMDERIRVLRDTMLGRSLVLNVLRNLDLDIHANNSEDLERMINSFQNKTDIKIRNNSLITVSFIHRDPALAKNYINNLVNEYLEKNIFAKREEAYNATKFLEKQVAFFKGKMDKGEDEVIKFRQEQGIYIATDEGSIINEIKNHLEEISTIEIQKKELIARKKSIEAQLSNEDPFTVAMYSTSEIKKTIESLENRIKQLLVRYTENYPDIIKLKAEIEVLKNQNNNSPEDYVNNERDTEISAANPVYQRLKQRLAEVETEIIAFNAKNDHLNTLIRNKKKELRVIPENRKKLADLEKERDSFRSVYQQLLARLGQSEVSKQMEIEDKATTFRIIEPAIMPSIPITPSRVRMILTGIIFGFIVSFGVIFLLDYIDNSVKTSDVLKTFGLPVLAIIPKIQSSETIIKRKKKDILLYSFAGVYMLCILGVLVMEYLGLTYVEEFIHSSFVNHYL